MTNDEDLKIALRSIYDNFNRYWDLQRAALRSYSDLYEVDFWRNGSQGTGLTKENSVQTAHANKFIEQFVSVLFLKQPGVIVGPDPTTKNDTAPIEALVNRWLKHQRRVFEEATRIALIFPSAFLKLSIDPNVDLKSKKVDSTRKLDALSLDVVFPWDVLVDRQATSWKSQRFVGCQSWTSMSDMEKRYPRALSQLRFTEQTSYFDSSRDVDDRTIHLSRFSSDAALDRWRWVRVIEFWDLEKNELIIWTPDGIDGIVILEDPKECPTHEANTDKPMSQLVPLYFNWVPAHPLDGISELQKVYSQFVEINHARTYRADAVKKNARKYLADSEVVDDEILSQFNSALDGEVILAPLEGRDPHSIFTPVKIAPLDDDFNIFVAELERDVERATSLPAMARGQETGVTATEVGYLQNYAANLVGKLAREKAEMLEATAYLYIRSLCTFLEKNERMTVDLGSGRGSASLTRDNLAGTFTFDAVDGNTNPITHEAKKQELIQVAPFLIANGANKRAVLAEMVRLMELPVEFLEEETPPVQQTAPVAAPQEQAVNASVAEQQLGGQA